MGPAGRPGVGFVHLHVHSAYSFFDGAAPLDGLVRRAAELGMPALALTDHNSLSGALRFYEKAREAGIKPILGAEVEVEGGHRLVLLCKDLRGYHNLCRLLTEAHLSHRNEGPAASRAMVARYGEGLIALSGSTRGEVPALLDRADWEKAERAARWYRSVFGHDFYLELTYYPGPEGKGRVRRLAAFAEYTGLPTVATNNVHYLCLEDYALKELRQVIWENSWVQRLHGRRTVEQYLKSPREMAALFREVPGAIKATAEIAERCNLELPLRGPKFPAFPLPPGKSADGFLRELALQGARERFPRRSGRVLERLDHELTVIQKTGFAPYFLVAWDIARFARERRIRFTVRGSAANSLVVYCLGISHINPLEHGLLFERFLHQAREEMPDIDLDFPRTRRDEVRDYLIGRYGRENVAAVATVSTYQARGIVRDAAKAMGISTEEVEEVLQGVRGYSVDDLLELRESLPELRANTAPDHPGVVRFLKLCRRLDGFPKGLSVHLGGLVIGPGNLSQWAPLQWTSGGDVICQYDKEDVERLGLLKMDCLMVPTLDVIEDTVRLVKETRGETVDIDRIPRDDPAAMALHRRADTIGCFQVESPAQREMAGRLLPERYQDLILLLALIRPGPMKSRMHEAYLQRRRGREAKAYPHAVLEPVLKETLGVIVYQEQVLEVAHRLAGLSYEEADGLRRGMTHERPPEAWQEMKRAFLEGCRRRGVASRVAEDVWRLLAEFASYGFPKGHSVAYAEPAYQTLWLRAHYLPEFLCSLLNNQPMGYYPPRVLVMDARSHGVPVLPLDVNRSHARWTVEQGALRVGLCQLKGMTASAQQAIHRARSEGGEFRSLFDFVSRTDVAVNVCENLIKAGAFDSIAPHRRWLLVELARVVERWRCAGRGSYELIETAAPPPEALEDFSPWQRVRMEWELLGFPLVGHPVDFAAGHAELTRCRDLAGCEAGTRVRVAGCVVRYQTPPVRSGKRVVFICLEDGTGLADVAVFEDVQQRAGEVLFKEPWLLVEGTLHKRGPEAISITALKLLPLRIPVETAQSLRAEHDHPVPGG